MTSRGALRALLIGTVLLAGLPLAVGCYRAEVDLAPLLDEQSSVGGGSGASAAGEPEQTGGGGAGAPACEMVTEEPSQYQCRLRPPSQEVCDTQDPSGWAGCYNGGCSVCTEVLAKYPSYLARHPCCTMNTTCGVHAPLKCSPLCPPPTALDALEPCFDLER